MDLDKITLPSPTPASRSSRPWKAALTGVVARFQHVPGLLLLYLLALPGIAQSVRFNASFGGSGSDTGFAVAHHGGFSYVAGRTTSPDFPVTDGSTYRGDTGEVGDIFVVKLDAKGQVVAATLLGGSGSDFANGLAITDGQPVRDGTGGETVPKVLTLSGWTGSTDFRTLNPIQSTNGGKTDAVVAQFDLNLVLLFSTYLGGAEDDQFSGLTPVINDASDDDLMFFGFTTSTNFPFPTPNAADPTTTVKNLTTNADGLLVRMNRNRTIPMASLLRRTSSGNGTQNEVILAGTSGLIIPGSGFNPAQYALYVTGWTDNDFFRHSSDPTGSGRRIFLTEISPDTGGRLYSRVLGGSGDDIGQAVAITAHGVVVLGQTTSTDLPNAQPLFQAAPGGGTDAVLVGWQHLPSGLPLFARPAYVAYLGGSGEDSGRALAAAFGPQFPQSAVAERLHFAGVTGSANLPLLTSPQQPPAQATYGGGATDGFFGRLATVPNPESTGPALLLEAKNLTFDGGTDADAFTSVAAKSDNGADDFASSAAGAVRKVLAPAGRQFGLQDASGSSAEEARLVEFGTSGQPLPDLIPKIISRKSERLNEALVISILNKGTVTATGLSIDLSSNPTPPSTGEIIEVKYQGETLQPSANGTTFLLPTSVTLEESESLTVEVTVRTLPAALVATRPGILLFAEAQAAEADVNPSDNTLSTLLERHVDLEVTLVSAFQPPPGQLKTRYKFIIRNVGANDALDATVVFTGSNLREVSYDDLSRTGVEIGDLDGGPAKEFRLTIIRPGHSIELEIVATAIQPNAGTRITVKAQDVYDSNLENGEKTGQTEPKPLPDLSVRIEDRPSLLAGREENLTLVISNHGPGEASGIIGSFVDLSGLTEVIKLTTATGSFPIKSDRFTLPNVVLPAGAFLEVEVTLKTVGGVPSITLLSGVRGSEPDANVKDNDTALNISVIDLSENGDLGFGLPGAPVPAGETLSISLNVGNTGTATTEFEPIIYFPSGLPVTESPPECKPVTPNAAWFITVMREAVGHMPNELTLADALKLIEETGDRRATAEALLDSPKYYARLVNQLYPALLGRNPTDRELASAVFSLTDGLGLAALARQIQASSPESRTEELTQELLKRLVPQKTLEELIALSPNPIYRCELESIPAGGTVSLPFRINPLHPGVYVVAAEAPNYQPVQAPVPVIGAQDFGDAPALGMSPALFPPILGTYPVLAANNGARHQVNPDIGLGNLTDVDIDGQPHLYGLGDADDEDGVMFRGPLAVVVPGVGGPTPIPAVTAPALGKAGDEVKVDVQVRAPAFGLFRLNAWVDFNRDGDWADPREQVITNKVVLPGVTQFQFTVPNDVDSGLSFARFRLSSAETLDSTGPAPDGEVEDHLVLLGPLERGDAPAVYGAAPHLFPPNPVAFLGVKIDPDEVQPSVDARADDTDADGDDEDGVTEIGPFFAGVTSSLVITASEAGFVDLWLDYNRVNGFEANPAAPDPTEYVNASILGLPVGAVPAPIPVVAGPNVIRFQVPDRVNAGLSFLRVRYTPMAIPDLGPVNLAPSGEVEDYRVQLYPLAPDFGDAPDSRDVPQYPTLRANNGAFHLVTEDRFFLGQRVDVEPDGFSGLDALGDDQDNGLENPADPEPDDEDGVQFLTPLTPGQPASVQLVVTAQNPGPAFVNAWVDFNGDFDWADPGEQVLVDAPVVNGTNIVSIAVPPGARPGNTYARFRLTRDRGIGFTGAATSGEIEDYLVTVVQPAAGLRLSSIVQVGSDVELRWDGNPVLESAPTVNGPWAPVNGATSPFRTPTRATATQFYRLTRP